MKICVFGASSDTIPPSYLDAAYDFGKQIGENGHSLVFGGGNTGVMGKAVRGIKAVGGYAVGIAPKFFDVPGVLYENCNEFIYTETMRERKGLLEDVSDAFAVLPGGIGTYEEFFETLVLCQLGQMKKPIAIYNVNGCYDDLRRLLISTVEKHFMPEENLSLCRFCDTAEEIIDYFKEFYEVSTPRIIKAYREDVPAMRFIGKRYSDYSGWGEWFANGWFDIVEQAMGGTDNILKIWKNGSGYVGLEHRRDGELVDYFIGMFAPAGTIVPEGFVSVDFPAAGIGTTWIYGKENEVHSAIGGCRAAIDEIGLQFLDRDGEWSFENGLCPRFTTPDEHGNVILDYCYYVK